MRVCMQVADLVEREVRRWVEQVTTVVETVCRQVTRQIEEFETQWQNQCRNVSRQVCSWAPWPLSELCNWVTEQVCELVAVVVRIVRTIVETVCEVVTTVIRTFVLLVMTVVVTVLRFVCFWVGFIVNWIRIIVAAIVGIPEFLTCLLGLRLRKHLPVCVTVLADRATGQPVMDDATVTRAMDEARRIILERTNVEVHEHDRKVLAVPSDQLTVTACDAGQLFSTEAVDLTAAGERSARFGDLLGCGRNVGDQVEGLITAPLNVIFIADIVAGNDIGCHIPGTDYVIVDRVGVEERFGGEVVAHEIGHACDLWHVEDTTNLMNPAAVGGTNLRQWQVCIFRRARFVTYIGAGFRL